MSEENKPDIIAAFGWIIAPVLIVFSAWYFLGKPFTRFLLVVSPPAFEFAAIHVKSPIISNGVRAELARISQKIPEMDIDKAVQQAPWKITRKLMTGWGYILRPVLIPILLILGFLAFKHVPSRLKYREGKSMIELAKQNAEKFPCLWPAIRAEVYKRDQFVGTWKMPLTTIEWVVTNGLLIYKKGEPNELKIPPQGVEFVKLNVPRRRRLHAKDFKGLQELVKEINKSRERENRIDISGLSNFMESFKYFSLDEEKCDALLRKQIGAKWQGLDALPPLERAFAISLMAIICGGALKTRGFDMLDQISKTFIQAEEDKDWNIIGESKADLSGVDELKTAIEKHANYKYIKGIISQHYYVSTVFMRLLSREHGGARKNGGKVPPILFHWLKPHNETLYRVLDKVDAQRPWVEGTAAFHHFHNEVKMRQAFAHAHIEGATASIVRELHRQEWLLDEDLDRKAQEERAVILAMLKKADEATKTQPKGTPPMGGGGGRQRQA